MAHQYPEDGCAVEAVRPGEVTRYLDETENLTVELQRCIELVAEKLEPLIPQNTLCDEKNPCPPEETPATMWGQKVKDNNSRLKRMIDNINTMRADLAI